MERETIKAAARSQHELAIAHIPDVLRESCEIETREEMASDYRFRIHSRLFNRDNQEMGQVETNADLQAEIVRETLVSYRYLP